MTREEFTEKAAAILDNLEDRGAVSTMLDELRTAFYKEVENSEKVEAERDELESKNAGLQQANMDLFLKLGKPATGMDEENEPKEPERKEPELKFEELFDEKGELKA